MVFLAVLEEDRRIVGQANIRHKQI